ncbi:MAG TPA: hypothetical protein VN442_18465 [Bryobacteraceae bacterium]|nr:hypothetical protein [Bryobacteraceae bacterium]
MLDGLKRKMAAVGVMGMLRSLASDKNTQTTITGVIAGAIVALPGLDMAKVIAGDPGQIAHLVAGVAIAALGFLATKENMDGHATLLGTVAGALYAMQGTLETLMTGVVIAALGYFTNKPAVGDRGRTQ